MLGKTGEQSIENVAHGRRKNKKQKQTFRCKNIFFSPLPGWTTMLSGIRVVGLMFFYVSYFGAFVCSYVYIVLVQGTHYLYWNTM